MRRQLEILASVAGILSLIVALLALLRDTYDFKLPLIKEEANRPTDRNTTQPPREFRTPALTLTDSNSPQPGTEFHTPATSPENGTSKAGVAIVFDPPSNVRKSPNGEILCSVRERKTINIYGSTGSWYETDVCGQRGVIDISQIKF